jgi:DNA modification methylase
MSNYVLHHGDCLDILPTLEAQSVDAVIADIPSGRTACAWDSVIPFEPMWKELRRVIKPRGAIVLLGCTQPFTSALVMSWPQGFKYTWVWEKDAGTNFYNAPYQPFKVHEDIAVFSLAAASFSRRGVMSYYPQVIKGKPYTAAQGRAKHTYHAYADAHTTVNNGTRYPRSVLKFNGESGLHPTQKPLALLEYLVRTYTNAGDTVLDFCAGSGTTGAACGNLGRSFIGIEKDADYFAVARDRIAGAYEPLGAMQVAV